MEHPGNEETGPSDPSPVVQQLQQPDHHDDIVIAATASGGVSASNGTARPASSVADGQATKEPPISAVVPPYWRHHRDASRASQTSIDTSISKPAITLEDHTEDPNSDTSRGLWAKSVTIDDHVVVYGKTGVGAYVVWICKIEMLEVGGSDQTSGWSELLLLTVFVRRAVP